MITSAAAPALAPIPEYLIDKILRSREPHLISGPADSGKTTLLLQILDDWRNSRPIFTHDSHPVPYCVVACDRPLMSLRDTMRRMALDYESIPHFSMIDQTRPVGEDFSIHDVLTFARRHAPNASALFIDGLSALCPGKIIDARDVRRFLQETSKLCQEKNVTILGTVPSPKSRDGEGYSSPQDRILGSGAWASHVSTKYVLDLSEDKITLHILPKNFPKEKVELMFSEAGLLVPWVESLKSSELDAWLATLDKGAVFNTDMALMVGGELSLSRRAVFYWLKQQVSLGTILKIDRGEYRVTGDFSEN
jgi:RecA-family ATPase